VLARARREIDTKKTLWADRSFAELLHRSGEQAAALDDG